MRSRATADCAAITCWQQLLPAEQAALARVLGPVAARRFDHDFAQIGRDSLINIFYLMTSARVAGDLWQYLAAIRWAGGNQLGIETQAAPAIKEQLIISQNFRADGAITCRYKKAHWSLRQRAFTASDNTRAPIRRHGLQIYYPSNPAETDSALLVVDIDTIVFASLLSWLPHARDILWPDAALNDPLNVRATLQSRDIFPGARMV